MHDEKVLTRFIRDVALHRLEVLREDGVYRHLRFKRPGTNAYYFDIVTWPGYLTVTGDMGTWTFSREHDMVRQFFPSDIAGGINPGYWSEKIEAGTCGGYDKICMEFDEKAFAKRLDEWLAGWREECGDDCDEDEIESALDTVADLKRSGFNDSRDALNAVNNAEWPDGVSSWDIAEGMYGINTFSHHFRWICYAVVWGIGRYEASKIISGAVDKFIAFRAAA